MCARLSTDASLAWSSLRSEAADTRVIVLVGRALISCHLACPQQISLQRRKLWGGMGHLLDVGNVTSAPTL